MNELNNSGSLNPNLGMGIRIPACENKNDSKKNSDENKVNNEGNVATASNSSVANFNSVTENISDKIKYILADVLPKLKFENFNSPELQGITNQISWKDLSAVLSGSDKQHVEKLAYDVQNSGAGKDGIGEEFLTQTNFVIRVTNALVANSNSGSLDSNITLYALGIALIKVMLELGNKNLLVTKNAIDKLRAAQSLMQDLVVFMTNLQNQLNKIKQSNDMKKKNPNDTTQDPTFDDLANGGDIVKKTINATIPSDWIGRTWKWDDINNTGLVKVLLQLGAISFNDTDENGKPCGKITINRSVPSADAPYITKDNKINYDAFAGKTYKDQASPPVYHDIQSSILDVYIDMFSKSEYRLDGDATKGRLDFLKPIAPDEYWPKTHDYDNKWNYSSFVLNIDTPPYGTFSDGTVPSETKYVDRVAVFKDGDIPASLIAALNGMESKFNIYSGTLTGREGKFYLPTKAKITALIDYVYAQCNSSLGGDSIPTPPENDIFKTQVSVSNVISLANNVSKTLTDKMNTVATQMPQSSDVNKAAADLFTNFVLPSIKV